MKIFLVMANVLLAVVIAWRVAGSFSEPEVKKTTVRRQAVKKESKAEPAETLIPAPPEINSVEERANAVKIVVESDVFNAERSPASGGGRVELTLVGTFKIGNIEGAIIRVNQPHQRQINPFMMMGGPGGMGGQNSNLNRGVRNQRNANGRLGAARQRFGNANWGANSGNVGNPSANAANKQYVRIGETLSNGYMLAEISRTRAVLTRGSDKMELELQDPSKSVAKGAAGPKKLNTNQQLQQAQIATQQMLMRTLMNMNGGGGQRSGASRGGGARGGRR